VSGKCFDSLVTLATLMSPVDNYSQYKQHQGQRTGPYVPFLGVMLSDLSFIDDFNVSKSPAGLNFAKAAQMSEIIEPFATCQVSLSLSRSLICAGYVCCQFTRRVIYVRYCSVKSTRYL